LVKKIIKIIRKGLRLMAKKSGRFIYWIPRILAILFIFLLALMSLDVITPENNLWQTITGLFMHNIPTLVLLIVLIISWKHELIGGIVFILAGLLYIFWASLNVPWYLALSWSITIAGPAFLIGILFMINWYRKKKQVKEAGK
jgi:hypothetical protein